MTITTYTAPPAAAAGGGPAVDVTGLTLLSTTAVSGSSFVTVSAINQTYRNLQIIVRGCQFSAGNNIYWRLNGDTGGNYWSGHNYYASSSMNFFNGGSGSSTITLPSGWSSANGLIKISIPDYANSTTRHFTEYQYFEPNNFFIGEGMGVLTNTATSIAAVTSFSFGGSSTFTGGTMLIYGEK